MKYSITVPVTTTVIYYGIEANSEEEAKEILRKSASRNSTQEYGTDFFSTPGDYWEEDTHSGNWEVEEEEEEEEEKN